MAGDGEIEQEPTEAVDGDGGAANAGTGITARS